MKNSPLPQAPKILIVDDERDLVEIITLTLEKRGYETILAHDGVEAWEKIQTEKPDFIILDLMLPGLDGWQICRMVRQHEKGEIRETPILMISARAQTEDRVQGLGIGADDYLTKPFSLQELILRLDLLLKKGREIRDLHGEMERLRNKMEEQGLGIRQVIHDIKNPLISMGASAKLLMRRTDEEENLGFLKGIYENSLRLSRWLEDTILFPDLKSKDSAEEAKEVNVESFLKRVILPARGTAAEKRIQLEVTIPPDLPMLLCNESLMERALENLIVNALKYTPEGGLVEMSVALGSAGDYLEFIVRDSGIGIDPQDLPGIFEPFRRGKNANGEQGIGLGLAIVKKVADLHGGCVRVLSEPLKGSLFSLVLPVRGKSKEEREFVPV